ncbi:UNVERIFIED_CONTAM: hypothetical protein FKN15_078421 [Acipenser sinensis]
MVSHDSGVGSQPSAVVEPSAGSEGQEKGGPQPADLVSEDPVLEGSGVGGDSLRAQVGPFGIPPSDETPQSAGSVVEMPVVDGYSAGEEKEFGSAGLDEEDGLSNTSQLSDITANQRGKLYSLKEISDFLERTKGSRGSQLNAPGEPSRGSLVGGDAGSQLSTAAVGESGPGESGGEGGDQAVATELPRTGKEASGSAELTFRFSFLT